MGKFNITNEEAVFLERLGIEALILFGSQAQGTATERSDYDVGVLVSDLKQAKESELRRKLYDALYDFLSSKINKLVDIDIVFLEDAPAELQSHVVKYGVSLYEKRVQNFPRFKERIMQQYADFEPIRHLFHHAIMKRISETAK
ncbi:MAG: hypothetical protein G01um101433_571 [Parcubacteria group bacterium Gr01-1014_33]|nr:MAG: hypothetical protein G01um101433_571 [Parcubacteria group bacterium Gr01-1014_33]